MNITHEIYLCYKIHDIHDKIYDIKFRNQIDVKIRNKMWEKLELMNGSISEHVCDQIEDNNTFKPD